MYIPFGFKNHVIKVYDSGSQWLNKLPNIVNYLVNKWQLIDLIPISNLLNNYVACGYSKVYSTNIILKLPFFTKEFNNEKAALLHFQDTEAINKLLDYDDIHDALLLKKVGEGVSLKSLFPENDSQAVNIAATIINKLHQANNKPCNNHDCPELSSQLAPVLDRFTHPNISEEFFKLAQNFIQELLNSENKNYLLHGDLHHLNIIQDTDGSWISIDPKGVVGPIEYEVGAFIRNPAPYIFEQNNLEQLLNNRFSLFAALLNLDKERLIRHSYLSTLLAIAWDIEDMGTYYKGWLKCLTAIKKLI